MHSKGIEWSDNLPKLAYAHDTAVSQATNYPPYLMRFGKMPAPLHGYIEEADRLRIVAPKEDHVLQTAEELREIFELAQAALVKRNPRVGISSDDIPQLYNIGDLVLYRTVEPSKLDPAWDGPLEIIACHPPRYEVQRLGEEGIGVDPWIEHAHNIKPYRSLLSYHAQRQAPKHDPEDDTFVVARILKDRKRHDGEVEFLTTYLGFENDSDHHSNSAVAIELRRFDPTGTERRNDFANRRGTGARNHDRPTSAGAANIRTRRTRH